MGWNSLPKNVRNLKNCDIEHFKEVLDCFLSKVPDEPRADGLTPGATDIISGRATNSLEFQCARRTLARATSCQKRTLPSWRGQSPDYCIFTKTSMESKADTWA